jgi:hypothetical protein
MKRITIWKQLTVSPFYVWKNEYLVYLDGTPEDNQTMLQNCIQWESTFHLTTTEFLIGVINEVEEAGTVPPQNDYSTEPEAALWNMVAQPREDERFGARPIESDTNFSEILVGALTGPSRRRRNVWFRNCVQDADIQRTPPNWIALKEPESFEFNMRAWPFYYDAISAQLVYIEHRGAIAGIVGPSEPASDIWAHSLVRATLQDRIIKAAPASLWENLGALLRTIGETRRLRNYFIDIGSLYNPFYGDFLQAIYQDQMASALDVFMLANTIYRAPYSAGSEGLMPAPRRYGPSNSEIETLIAFGVTDDGDGPQPSNQYIEDLNLMNDKQLTVNILGTLYYSEEDFQFLWTKVQKWSDASEILARCDWTARQ